MRILSTAKIGFNREGIEYLFQSITKVGGLVGRWLGRYIRRVRGRWEDVCSPLPLMHDASSMMHDASLLSASYPFHKHAHHVL